MANTADSKTILAVAVGSQKDFLINARDRLNEVRPYVAGLIDKLEEQKVRLGTDFVIAYIEREPEELNRAVADAVAAKSPSLIFPMSTTALQAALNATRSTPIVFPSISNPADDGVAPGGNATGVSASRTQSAAAGLERFIAVVDTLKTVYALHKAGYAPATRALASLQAPSPKVRVESLAVGSRDSIQQAIAGLPKSNPGEAGILVLPSDLMLSAAETIVESAHARKIPTFFPITDRVTADGRGALGGYGVPQRVCGELAADYVHKILWQGKKPQDLPVTKAQGFECVVSGRAADNMGIKIKDVSGVKRI